MIALIPTLFVLVVLVVIVAGGVGLSYLGTHDWTDSDD